MKRYDLTIIGGGLSGLTLALQIKQKRPETSVLVLEKRAGDAPVATHKVGESTVELGAFYLREVLQLKANLTERQLPKFGFRFFFSPQHRNDIVRRVEMGSKVLHPIPTHQIDRGILENDLLNIVQSKGVDVLQGVSAKDVQLAAGGHEVFTETDHGEQTFTSRWVVDASGRRSLLKRKLGLEKSADHAINSAWFRLESEIDPDAWSDNPEWLHYLEPGRRRLATNHLMGTGYWVWLIPLVSGATSIGIVADPAIHPFEQFNTFEKAMQWLQTHEPQAAAMLGKHRVMDFKVMKHYAHDIKQLYSADRWGITGDAGAFLDPLYSPGTDFISLSNSWLTDLVTRELDGENISLRTMIFEHVHRELLNGWLKLYHNMYNLFGNTQIMVMKIVWDWGTYWGIPTLIFYNQGYTDLDFLKQYSATANSVGRRFARLNENMQALFQHWNEHCAYPCADERINVFDLECLHRFHRGLTEKIAPADLIGQVNKNLTTLEHMAAEIFRLVSARIHGTPADMPVDPYQMSLNDDRAQILEKATLPTALQVNAAMQADLAKVWFAEVEINQELYV